jgi:hypothetical protein
MKRLGQRFSEMHLAQGSPSLILLRLSDNDAFVISETRVATNLSGVGNNGRHHHAQFRY